MAYIPLLPVEVLLTEVYDEKVLEIMSDVRRALTGRIKQNYLCWDFKSEERDKYVKMMIESGYDKYGLIDLDTENRIKFHYTQKILDDLKNSITAEIDSEKYVLEIEEEIRGRAK